MVRPILRRASSLIPRLSGRRRPHTGQVKSLESVTKPHEEQVRICTYPAPAGPGSLGPCYRRATNVVPGKAHSARDSKLARDPRSRKTRCPRRTGLPVAFRTVPRSVRSVWCLGLAACGGGIATGQASLTPARPEQAPLVTVRQVVEGDTLVGRRVRVSGACALAGAGPSTGAWVLLSEGWTVEVRGLVPRSCYKGGDTTEPLTIFAQVEPKGPDSDERLLLRLPE